jgi:hypothetical protein
MPKDTRNLLRVLQSELIFLDAGGYSAWAGARWRLPLVFEESPACPNLNDSSHSTACRDCALIKLVPLRSQSAAVPCRHIPLDNLGQTLESLYRTGSTQELTRVYRVWLVRMIEQLERKQTRLRWLHDKAVYTAAEST